MTLCKMFIVKRSITKSAERALKRTQFWSEKSLHCLYSTSKNHLLPLHPHNLKLKAKIYRKNKDPESPSTLKLERGSKATVCSGEWAFLCTRQVTCTSVKEPLTLSKILRFCSNMCHYPDVTFFSQGLTYFSKTTPNRILHVLQQHDST